MDVRRRLARRDAWWSGGAIITVFAAATAFGQPPARSSPAAADNRASIYDAHCAECHGKTGKGDGPAAPFLTPRPLDLTAGKYKIRSTETGSLPTDDDLQHSIANGLPGSAMPGWRGVLSDAEIRAAVEYIKGLSPRFANERLKPVATTADVPATPASVARGERVYAKLKCAACHGTDGRGSGAITTEFWDDWKQPLRAADLTAPWTFHGGGSRQDVYLRFRTGMSGTPMPAFGDSASETEMRDLANYVAALARKPIWSMAGSEAATEIARIEAADKANPVKRGAYLVDTVGCALCHSPFDDQKRMLPGMRLAGGLLIRVVPFGDFPTGNLTSDRETGLGSWTDDEIKRTITRGILKDGTRLLPYPMDWASFSNFTAGDLDAIVAYLRTVPPVRNRVPRPRWTPFPAYMWGKFKMLMLGSDPPILFFPGNAGAAGASR